MNPGRPALSPRQEQILRLLSAGRSNKEIARELGLSDGTIKQHLFTLFRKMGVKNRTMAVVQAGHLLQTPPSAAPVAADSQVSSAPNVEPAAMVDAESSFVRRWVTAVVCEFRPEEVRSAQDATLIGRIRVDLAHSLAGLVQAYDGQAHALPGGSLLAVFGAPMSHGDDPARAVDFARCALSLAPPQHQARMGIGIATAQEMMPQGRSDLTGTAYRQAQRLAMDVPGGAIGCCDLTRALCGWSEAGRQTRSDPEDVRSDSHPLMPAAWGGFPFLEPLKKALSQGRTEWVSVSSWPVEDAHRLQMALVKALNAEHHPALHLWAPASKVGAPFLSTLLEQIRLNARRWELTQLQALQSLGDLTRMLRALKKRPVIAVHGIGTWNAVLATVDDTALFQLAEAGLGLVLTSTRTEGEAHTEVRLVGPNPRRPMVARTFRQHVPSMPSSRSTLRADLQALLDSLPPLSQLAAALASLDRRGMGIDELARRLRTTRANAMTACSALVTAGVAVIAGDELLIRDALTADAVRASISEN